MLSTITDQALAAESAAAKQVAWLLQRAASEPLHSPSAWPWLEAAHIVGQTRFALLCMAKCMGKCWLGLGKSANGMKCLHNYCASL
jgi:hypothetical protein